MSFKEKLKQEVEKIMTVTEYGGGWTVKKKVDVDELFNLINQLDEPEVLSEDWIDDNKKMYLINAMHAVPVNKLQNLLVPKQELPVIPQFVAEWIDFKKKSEISYDNIFQAIDELYKSRTSRAHSWVLKTDENKDAFARAWLDGYTVEEEQKYYVYLGDGQYLVSEDKLKEPYVRIRHEEDSGFANHILTFTEQEIKDYDERYMAFAKPVEELE